RRAPAVAGVPAGVRPVPSSLAPPWPPGHRASSGTGRLPPPIPFPIQRQPPAGGDSPRERDDVHDHTDFSLLYDALGIRPGCSVDELRAAYRRVAASLHPDAGGRGMDVEKLQQINRIYHAATQFQRIHGRLPGEPTPLHAAAPAAEARTARGVVATHAGAHHDARAGAMVPMAGPGRRLRFLLLAGVMAAAVAGLLELRGDA